MHMVLRLLACRFRLVLEFNKIKEKKKKENNERKKEKEKENNLFFCVSELERI